MKILHTEELDTEDWIVCVVFTLLIAFVVVGCFYACKSDAELAEQARTCVITQTTTPECEWVIMKYQRSHGRTR